MKVLFDIIIVILLVCGALAGYRKGIIKAGADFVCTLFAIILAFILKNPLSVILYTNLPFFKFKGIYEGISVLNIVIYELIAYVIILFILMALMKYILKLTGVLEKLIDATLVLALPSKICGLIFGFIESYLVILIILFALGHVPNAVFYATESNVGEYMIDNTPVLSDKLADSFEPIDDIFKIAKEYKENANREEANEKAFELLIKDKVITKDNAKKLVEKKKIDIKNADKIIEKY